jgi:hypothetical protein
MNVCNLLGVPSRPPAIRLLAAAPWAPAQRTFTTECCDQVRNGATAVELIRPEGTQE